MFISWCLFVEQDIVAQKIFNGREKYHHLMCMKKAELLTYFNSKSDIVERLVKCGDISAKTDEDWRVLAVMVHSLECTGL